MSFKTAAVVPNLTKKRAYTVSIEAISLLRAMDIAVIMSKRYRESYRNIDVRFVDDSVLYSSCDLVITIGGDGTIIHAARHTSENSKPLLGINTGRLGFVAEIEPNELSLLTRLASGEYTIEKRMLIKVIHKSRGAVKEYLSVNDAVISRGSLSRLIDINVSLAQDKGYICNYRADGLIFSTPTGSSAYSLAAGGPVVEPTMKCIIMTPICSHALFARPVVFSHESDIVVKASCDDDTEVFLTIDGAKTETIKKDDTVVVTCAEEEAELIRLKNKTFYRVLNDKFTERGG